MVECCLRACKSAALQFVFSLHSHVAVKLQFKENNRRMQQPETAAGGQVLKSLPPMGKLPPLHQQHPISCRGDCSTGEHRLSLSPQIGTKAESVLLQATHPPSP